MDELNTLRNEFSTVMNNYGEVYDYVLKNNDWKNGFRDHFAKIIPSLISTCAKISNPYVVEGSYGKGRWTAVPWIAIFDTRITKSAQKGVYIVYLLNKDSKELYLTLNQGATTVIQSDSLTKDQKPSFTGMTGSSSEKNLSKLRNNAKRIRETLRSDEFNCDDDINTGSVNYDAGSIFYRKYTLNDLPSGEELIIDLLDMIDLYSQYEKQCRGITSQETIHDEWWPSLNEYDPGISKEQWLDILSTPEIIGPVWGGALAMFYDQGGAATCSELADIYGKNPSGIAGNCTQLAMQIHKVTDCPLITEEGKTRYWPILFVGKEQEKGGKGNWIWKLRTELYDAIAESDIMKYLPNAENESEDKRSMEMSSKDAIEYIKAFIASKGFSYNSGLIENFYLSLKSKPFVILAGTSGTGKTRLVRLFAEAIQAEYKMVAVRPDWSDSSDLFGHVDLNGNFIAGEILDFISEAKKNADIPYILCLDEMNLARVEYYLSDFLSIIETRDLIGDHIVSDPLISTEKYGYDEDARQKYGEIGFPENLYLVGTVNMDETTFPFSKKVLDRANTIEFNYVDLNAEVEMGDDKAPLCLPNSFLRTKYLLLAQCKDDPDYVKEISSELQSMNLILQKANAHVGYRVRDEIVFYMLNNKETELLSRDEALDNEIMQKVLPRIQGSSSSVKEMLCDLFKVFAGDYQGYSTVSENLADNMLAKIRKDGARYPKSAEKTAFMVRRFEEDGFTSYWL